MFLFFSGRDVGDYPDGIGTNMEGISAGTTVIFGDRGQSAKFVKIRTRTIFILHDIVSDATLEISNTNE